MSTYLLTYRLKEKAIAVSCSHGHAVREIPTGAGFDGSQEQSDLAKDRLTCPECETAGRKKSFWWREKC